MGRAIILYLFCALSLAARAPRIWLDSTLLAHLQSKYAANTSDWQAFKAIADGYKGKPVSPYSTMACGGANFICWAGGWRASYQGSSYEEGAFYLGIAYQVTGDTGYSDTAIQILQAINGSWDGRTDCSTYANGSIPESVNQGWTSRTFQIAEALAYDWNYDRISPGDRALTASTTYCMFQWGAKHANDWPDRGAYPGANYFGGHLLGFGLSAIAMDGDDSRMTAIQITTRSWWSGSQANSVASQFALGVYQDGYNPESYTNYGAGHIERLLLYGLAVKTYTGVSVSADYANRLFHNSLYNIMPGRQRITAESDWIGPGVGDVPGSNFNLYAYLLSGTTDGEHAQYVWNNLPLGLDGADPKTSFANARLSLWDDLFVFGDTTRTAIDHSSTLSPLFASVPYSVGHTYIRTDWTDTAVWASYIGGIAMGGGHQISMAGNISINRGGDYLLPQIANWFGTNGVSGTPKIYDSPGASGYRGNTLYFYDDPYPYNSYGTFSGINSAGSTTIVVRAAAYVTCGKAIGVGRGTVNAEYVTLAATPCGSGTATLTVATPLVYSHADGEHLDTDWSMNYLSVAAVYFGGQTGSQGRGSFPPWAGVPDVMAVRQTPSFSYTLSQLTGAYDQVPSKLSVANRTLRSYYRTFIWMGDGYFIVKDRAMSHAPRAGVVTYDKLLFWHLTPGTVPAWTDPTVSGARVTTATIGSSKLVIDTLLPSNPALTIRKTDAGVAIGSPAVAGISSGRPDANLFVASPVTPLTYRLEVRDPSPSDTFEALTVLHAISSAATPAAASQVTEVSVTHRGVFIADVTPRIAVLPVDDTQTYTSVSFTQAWSGAGRVLAAGLAAGLWNVVQNSTQILTGAPVGPDGTLYFTPTGGGAFTLLQGGSGTAPTIMTTTLPDATVGSAYSQLLSATGTAPISWNVSAGALPLWLSLNARTGAISGMPTSVGTFSFTVTATNAFGASAKVFTLGSTSSALVVSPSSASAFTGSVTQTLKVSGGVAPYSWASPGASVMAGMGSTYAATYLASGVYTITATDSSSAFVNIQVTVTDRQPLMAITGKTQIKGGVSFGAATVGP